MNGTVPQIIRHEDGSETWIFADGRRMLVLPESSIEGRVQGDKARSSERERGVSDRGLSRKPESRSPTMAPSPDQTGKRDRETRAAQQPSRESEQPRTRKRGSPGVNTTPSQTVNIGPTIKHVGVGELKITGQVKFSGTVETDPDAANLELAGSEGQGFQSVKVSQALTDQISASGELALDSPGKIGIQFKNQTLGSAEIVLKANPYPVQFTVAPRPFETSLEVQGVTYKGTMTFQVQVEVSVNPRVLARVGAQAGRSVVRLVTSRGMTAGAGMGAAVAAISIAVTYFSAVVTQRAIDEGRGRGEADKFAAGYVKTIFGRYRNKAVVKYLSESEEALRGHRRMEAYGVRKATADVRKRAKAVVEQHQRLGGRMTFERAVKIAQKEHQLALTSRFGKWDIVYQLGEVLYEQGVDAR